MIGRGRKPERIPIFFSAIAVFWIVSCATPNYNPQAERSPSAVELQSITPRDAFLFVHKVATSPRCTNCHARGDRPIQLDGADSHFHTMYIHREFTQLGGLCITCHQDHNLDTPHAPPGAGNAVQGHWRMPSPQKSYDINTTAEELCRIWTGPSNQFEEGPDQGRQRTPAELLEHVTNDPLVNWGFAPGPGRTPALPPGVDSAGNQVSGHEIFIDYFKVWEKWAQDQWDHGNHDLCSEFAQASARAKVAARAAKRAGG